GRALGTCRVPWPGGGQHHGWPVAGHPAGTAGVQPGGGPLRLAGDVHGRSRDDGHYQRGAVVDRTQTPAGPQCQLWPVVALVGHPAARATVAAPT
ncbi:hypothetical protein NYY78_19190, partial [Acinetobacter baumannii]|nr:hypothetical protein [Acinetobacter baumannii]